MPKRKRKASSPAQLRQQHLFLRKGQFASFSGATSQMMYDTHLTPALRDKATLIHILAAEAEKMFDKEVGW